MGKLVNITNERFGRLIAVEATSRRSKGRDVVWSCLCDCGKIVPIDSHHLRSGNTKSCGCLHSTHRMSRTREYYTWKGIISRCTNSNHKDYPDYGGRGITVCAHWLKFENFYKDMGNRPNGKSIDRIDNNKGYYLKNCRWATPTEQIRNQRVQKRSKTGITGVIRDGQKEKYRARITVTGKRIHLGYFTSFTEAVRVRLEAEVKYES